MNKKGIRFHVKFDDYFGTIATRLDLLLQEIVRKGYTRTHEKELAEIRDEMLYMQQSYFVIKDQRGI